MMAASASVNTFVVILHILSSSGIELNLIVTVHLCNKLYKFSSRSSYSLHILTTVAASASVNIFFLGRGKGIQKGHETNLKHFKVFQIVSNGFNLR